MSCHFFPPPHGTPTTSFPAGPRPAPASFLLVSPLASLSSSWTASLSADQLHGLLAGLSARKGSKSQGLVYRRGMINAVVPLWPQRQETQRLGGCSRSSCAPPRPASGLFASREFPDHESLGSWLPCSPFKSRGKRGVPCHSAREGCWWVGDDWHRV